MKTNKHELAWKEHCRLNRSVSPFMQVTGKRSVWDMRQSTMVTQNYFSHKTRARMLGKTLDFNRTLCAQKHLHNSKLFKTQEMTNENGVGANRNKIEIDRSRFTPMAYKSNGRYGSSWISVNANSSIIMTNKMKSLRRRKVAKRLLHVLKKLHQTRHEITTNKFISLFPVKEFQLLKSKQFLAAVKENKIGKARELLKENKYLIYQFDKLKRTALHLAVQNNNQEMVKFLIRHKAFVNDIDLLGNTPLYYAIKNKNIDIAYVS